MECFHEVVNGTRATVEAYGECFNADRQDSGFKNIGEFHNLAALLGRGFYRDHDQLALDRKAWVEFADAHHIDELEQLFGHLLEWRTLQIHHDGDATVVRVFGWGNGQRKNVVAAPGKQGRHSRQHARAILHQHRQHVVL